MRMKYKVLLLTAITFITTCFGANAKNILSLKESITDNAIHYPSSFESDTKEMMESWYLRDFDFNSSYSTNTGTVSDRVYKERLQKLPTSIEMPFNQIVKSYIERYVVKGRTLVAQLVGMSSYYMPIFEAALERHNMPLELKYIPIIESALNPNAVSPAGAGGLWQFMKGTAQELGLEVNGEVDERYHIEKETEAACRYLKNAYARYGDWLTVAASYNAGQGGISRRRAEQKQQSALDLWMPEETSRYIFRILAAKRFFMNPASFGFESAVKERYPEIPVREIVTVSGPVESWADFAIEHGTSYYQLRMANLWIRDLKLTNKKNLLYRVIIPDDARKE